jgi:hypothetical protein
MPKLARSDEQKVNQVQTKSEVQISDVRGKHFGAGGSVKNILHLVIDLRFGF